MGILTNWYLKKYTTKIGDDFRPNLRFKEYARLCPHDIILIDYKVRKPSDNIYDYHGYLHEQDITIYVRPTQIVSLHESSEHRDFNILKFVTLEEKIKEEIKFYIQLFATLTAILVSIIFGVLCLKF